MYLYFFYTSLLSFSLLSFPSYNFCLFSSFLSFVIHFHFCLSPFPSFISLIPIHFLHTSLNCHLPFLLFLYFILLSFFPTNFLFLALYPSFVSILLFPSSLNLYPHCVIPLSLLISFLFIPFPSFLLFFPYFLHPFIFLSSPNK